MSGDAPYIELHAHSAFSFLDGASTPLELAEAGERLGYTAMALTDHDGVWGSREFAEACRGTALRAITGAELTICAGQRDAHVTLLVEDAVGYRNLCRLLTKAHAHTRDGTGRSAGQPRATLELLEEHAEGLVCLSGCARDGALAGAWERGEGASGERLGRRLLGAFGRERFRVELQRPCWRHDRARNRWLVGLGERLGVPCVATGNVHSHSRRRAEVQDALVAIRLGQTLEESEPRRRGNRSSALVPPEEMAARFAEHPRAVAETGLLAERLRFDLTRELGYRYPKAGECAADRTLAQLCRDRFRHRYGGARHASWAAGEARLEEELATIRGLGLSGFFLLHHELLELAHEVAIEVRGRGSARAELPPGRGRGSSVSSIVCFLTGLSHVDPIEANLFSGRFLNEESQTMPDIDLDFPRDVREALIPRIHEVYGADRSALVAAFPTYRPRGVVRDLGKALGLWPAEIERAARAVGHHGQGGEMGRDLAAGLGPERAASRGWQVLREIGDEMLGLPRHASQHSGGMVISTDPLIDICPVVPAAMEGRQTIQWDKDSCADAGLLKIDLLGLGMLSAVERCVVEVERTRGERLDLSRIPLDDRQTYESIRAAETTGTFQIESRAQMQMLPRTRPRNLDDLTVQVALVRPGPIQGGAVHPYIERRRLQREDPEGYEIPYEHPALEAALRETLGTIVYQEQVLEVAVDFAGFSHAEAERLRRAMSRKRSRRAIEESRERFLAGAARKHGVGAALAGRVWEQIEGFAGFGFPKAHSAAFALLAYHSAWLREHRGPEFLAALLNEQPMGFYPPDALVQEAQRRGIRVAPPDVNRSQVACHVESPRRNRRRRAESVHIEDEIGPSAAEVRGGLIVRIGLGYVKGVGGESMTALVAERERGGPYRGLAALAARSGASLAELERLAWAGALDGIPSSGDEGRREALWRVGVVGHGSGRGAAKDQLALPLEPPAAPQLEELGEWGELIADYRSTGIGFGRHPLELMRPGIDPDVRRSTDLARMADGDEVRVAGLIVARQRPETARGVVFMTLEDERGVTNAIVPRTVYERRRGVVRTSTVALIDGRLQHREGIVNVLVSEIVALDEGGSRLGPRGTDGAPGGRESLRRSRRAAIEELRAVVPAGHVFGRRGG